MSQSHEHTLNDASAGALVRSPPAGKLILLLALAVVMFILVLGHAPGINGPSYWQWNWRRLDGRRLFPAMALAAAPFSAAQYLATRRGIRPLLLLPLLMLATFALQVIVVAIETRPVSLEPVA